MKQQFFLVFSIFIGILTCIFLGVYIVGKEKTNEFQVKEGTAETKIAVNVSQVFSIKIESNLSTGYGWTIAKPKEKEESPVKFKKRTDSQDENAKEPRLMGAPMFEIFYFEALKAGEAVIELHYCRPWEKDVPPGKVHRVIVTIK